MAATLATERTPPPPSVGSGGSGGDTARYVVRKILSSVGTLFFVAVFNFFLFRVLPADPVKQLTRNHAVSPEQILAIRKQLGLDQALPRQFLTYLGALLHGDLGISFQYRQPVTTVIARRGISTSMPLRLCCRAPRMRI